MFLLGRCVMGAVLWLLVGFLRCKCSGGGLTETSVTCVGPSESTIGKSTNSNALCSLRETDTYATSAYQLGWLGAIVGFNKQRGGDCGC